MSRFYTLIIALSIALFGCDTTEKKEKADDTAPALQEEVPGAARLDSLTQLLDKKPDSPEILHQRAKAFLDVDEVNFALADVGRALMLDSSVAEYYLTVSDVYFRLNKHKQCRNALLKANALQPEYTEPLYRLAQFELYLGQHQKSIDYANDMLRIDARDDRPFMVKALCFKELGDTAKAINNYLEAVSENPDNFDAFVELGILHWAKNDPLAEEYLKAALDIRPNALDALYALGMQYQKVDKLNEALQTYTQIVELDSTYRSAYYNMGYIQYQNLQLYDEALVNFNKAVQVDPKYFQAVYMRGLCYEAKGDVDRAKREYSYAIELNPNYDKAADGLNRILGRKNR